MSYVEEIEGKTFQFICEHTAQTAHAKDFLFRVINWVGAIEDYAKQQQAAQQAASQPAEPAPQAEAQHSEAA